MAFRGVGHAPAPRPVAVRIALVERARQAEAHRLEAGREGLELVDDPGVCNTHPQRFAPGIPPVGHFVQYNGGTGRDEQTPTSAAGEVVAAYRARGLPEEASAFARQAVGLAAPAGLARARHLLWCCARLGAFGLEVGLAPEPAVLLHPATIDRFVARGLAGADESTRRSVRTNLRFVARRAAPELPHPPEPLRLGRARTKHPYSDAEVAAYLALARAQPTTARCLRLVALVCLSAGAGLDSVDLRGVTGRDVRAGGGGLVVDVHGPRARVAPVLARYHDDLTEAADYARDRYLCGGSSPNRRNITAALTGKLAGGAHLARLEVGRLRATWLREQVAALGLDVLLKAAGINCTQRLGDLAATLPEPDTETLVVRLGAKR